MQLPFFTSLNQFVYASIPFIKLLRNPEYFTLLGNGYIDFDELRLVLKSCMDESALKFSEDKLDELTRALFEDADTDNSGTISFEELQAELDKHPGVVENLTIRYTHVNYCVNENYLLVLLTG